MEDSVWDFPWAPLISEGKFYFAKYLQIVGVVFGTTSRAF